MKSAFYLASFYCFYVLNIYCVYSRYRDSIHRGDHVKSISFLIGQKQKTIFFLTMGMEMSTLLYECSDNTSLFSLISIYFLYLGMYGLICIKESNPVHYIFAGITFVAIFVYMSHAAWYLQKSYILNILLYIQYIIIVCLGLYFFDSSFFLYEVGYLLIFSLFYLVHQWLGYIYL